MDDIEKNNISILPTRFDFRQAVAEAMDSFPVLQRKAIFADVATGDILNADALKHHPDFDDFIKLLKKDIKLSRDKKVSFARASDDALLLTINSDKSSTPDPLVAQYFTLDHELGHVVIKRGNTPYIYPFIEYVADAYASLRCLQRFGQRGRDFLEWKSHDRADTFAARLVTRYMTSMVIDRILADTAVSDASQYDIAQTTALALAYADVWGHSKDELNDAADCLAAVDYRRGEKDPAVLYALVGVARASGNELACHIALRLAEPEKITPPPLPRHKTPIL